MEAEYIDYTEFFDVGDKVVLSGGFGVVVKTYELDDNSVVVGGDLIVRWDTRVEADYENCGELESQLSRANKDHEFKHINDDGTEKMSLT